MINDLLVDALVVQTARLVAHVVNRQGEVGLIGHLPELFQKGLMDELARLGVNQRVQAARWDRSLRSINAQANGVTKRMAAREQTVLQRVHRFITNEGPVTRQAIAVKFSNADEKVLASSLLWLVERGLVTRAGPRGQGVFRAVAQAATDQADEAELDAAAALLAVTLHNAGGLAREAVEHRLGVDRRSDAQTDPVRERRRTRIGQLLDRLTAQGKVTVDAVAGRAARFTCDRYHFGFNDSQRFEAALFDHFETMTNAFVHRLQAELSGETAGRSTGSTYHLDLQADDPYADRLAELVADFQRRLTGLRAEVDARNDAEPPSGPVHRQTVYFGWLRGTHPAG